MKSFDIYREDNPFGQADPALKTFPEEEIEMAFDTVKKKATCPETRHFLRRNPFKASAPRTAIRQQNEGISGILRHLDLDSS
jgi:hypothetical protein